MSYKKFLKSVSLPTAKLGLSGNESNNSFYNKYKNYLPVIYQGPNNRMERYTIYDGMEQDPVISWSMDIVTDFVIQSSATTPFKIEYEPGQDLPDSQTETIDRALIEWLKTNSWKKRLFNTVRDVLKYGDGVFVRDPETLELLKVNVYDIIGVALDDLKEPTHYIIKNVELNCPLQVINSATNDASSKNLLNTINSNFPSVTTQSTNQQGMNPGEDNTTLPIDAKNIVHISLNVDNSLLYPFGLSTLENIYKAYIQKMLLQDSVLLCRIKNAVEKMIFKIPVGGVPRHRRRSFLERAKNEMHQRRMPSKDSDGVFNTIDVAYSAIPMSEDYWLPIDENGNGPTIDKLAASNNIGEINDLVYWENVLIRGLKVPQSWVPYGPQDGQRSIPTSSSNTFVHEQRFFQHCRRLQNILIEPFDNEFKLFMRNKGINVNEDVFSLAFYPPSNITELTEMELQSQRLNLFTTATASPYISKKWAIEKYLGLTKEEINQNESMLIIELQEKLKDKDIKLPVTDNDQVPGLRSVGIDDIPMDYITDLQDASGGMGGMSDFGGDMGMGGMGNAPMGNAPMGNMGNSGGMGNSDTAF